MKDTDRLPEDFQNKTKELLCLIEVDKALYDATRPLTEVMAEVVEAIRSGWPSPEVCGVSVELEEGVFQSRDFSATRDLLKALVTVQGDKVGAIKIFLSENRPAPEPGPFLDEEVRLIESLAERLGHYLDLRRSQDQSATLPPTQIEHWFWRQQMAERIAREIDGEALGVVAVYLFGSVKNATSGPASDIDLLVHFRGDPQQESRLIEWFDSWSRCLEEVNFLKTGCRTNDLLDVHIITDEDIANRSSFAVKIGAVTDAARELLLGTD